MKRYLLFLLLLILFIPLPRAFSDPDIENLWCNSYTSNRLGWTTTGSSPYLDDTDGSSINTKTDGQTEGDFSFADLSSAGTITSVTLYLETYANDAPNDDGFNVWVYDGGSWTDEGLIQPATTGWGNYETLSLTTKLDTDTKVNAAQVYFAYKKSKGADDVYIRRAYLYVDYTPSSAEEYYAYPVQSFSLSSSAIRLCTVTRLGSQSFAITSSVEREWSLIRTLSQGLTFTCLALGDITKIFSRFVSMAFTVSANTFREWSLSRSLSQTLSLTSSTERMVSLTKIAEQLLTLSTGSYRNWSLIRTASQVMSLTFNALADLTQIVIRMVSIALSLSTETERGYSGIRVLSQAISFSFDSYRNWVLTRIVSQPVLMVFSSERVISSVRSVTQSISMSLNSERMVSFSRELSQSLSMFFDTWINYVEGSPSGKDFVRRVSAAFSLGLEVFRSWSLTRVAEKTISFQSGGIVMLGDVITIFVNLLLTFAVEGNTWFMANEFNFPLIILQLVAVSTMTIFFILREHNAKFNVGVLAFGSLIISSIGLMLSNPYDTINQLFSLVYVCFAGLIVYQLMMEKADAPEFWDLK